MNHYGKEKCDSEGELRMMKTWQILLIISLEEIELLSHDLPKFVTLSLFYLPLYTKFQYFITLLIVSNFLKNLCDFVLTNLCVLWYFVGIVIDYNSFWDLNIFFLNITCFGKNQTTSIFETYFWIRTQEKNFKHLEWKTMKDFPKTQINLDVFTWTW